MNNIRKVLEGIYNNLEIRRTIVPLFMGKTGLGKTHIVKQFVESLGNGARILECNKENKGLEKIVSILYPKLLTKILSTCAPYEVNGMAMRDDKFNKMIYLNPEDFLLLQDNDVLFLDELPNAHLTTLNAFLHTVEQRELLSGYKLPNIMIVAAGNYEGMTPMTPQIKERFVWYDVKFNASMWEEFMFNKYKLPTKITDILCNLIKNEQFTGYNFRTPRSLDKAVDMIIHNIPTPYDVEIKPILDTLIENKLGEIDLGNNEVLGKGELISWLKLKQLNNGTIKE